MTGWFDIKSLTRTDLKEDDAGLNDAATYVTPVFFASPCIVKIASHVSMQHSTVLIRSWCLCSDCLAHLSLTFRLCQSIICRYKVTRQSESSQQQDSVCLGKLKLAYPWQSILASLFNLN